MLRWKRLAVSAVAGLLLMGGVLAPAQAQADTEAEIEAVIEALEASWNDADAEAFGALFTDEGIVAFVTTLGAPPEITAEEARAELATAVGESPVEIQEIRDITVSGDSA